MNSRVLLATAVLALAAFGCAGEEVTRTLPPVVTSTVPPTGAPASPAAATQAPTFGEASVENIEILILESFPVQIHVVARGNLPDGCTTIDQIVHSRQGGTFLVTITTVRPADQACTAALVPFEQNIPLDVYGLAAGVYTVNVNGVSGTFELTVDNVLPTEEPPPGAIGGLVWHDLCAPPWGDTPPAPPEGCVESGGGGYEANGILEPGEPGIGGVQVLLGAGACPSVGLATTITAGDGSYAFPGLSAGTYCVSIDPLDATNETVLIPGDWTHPASGVGSATVNLAAGVDELGVNFGWDYQFAP